VSRIAITGAGGFLGGAVLRRATQDCEDVLAIVRSQPKRADMRQADLRDPRAVAGLLEGVGALVHLAAAKQGPFHDQYPSTVKATEVLLAEAERASVKRVVLVSSFAVYDFAKMSAGALLDESSPVDRSGIGRDGYSETKALQEEVALQWAVRTGVELAIVRPGVVYGPGSWWTYRLGEQFGRLWLCLGNDAEVPITYLDNCAHAIVHIALAPQLEHTIYNILDDDLPSQREYRRALAAHLDPKPYRVVVPWWLMSRTVDAVQALNARRARPLRLPGFLVPESLAVRAKPLRYTNRRLHESGWNQEVSFAQALAATFASGRVSGS
jgi:nucleoside-diphosphate-sugar epimerase